MPNEPDYSPPPVVGLVGVYGEPAMPRRPLSPCTADPRCPRLVARPGPCEQHGRERAKTRREREKSWADYGPEFQKLRALVLAARPICGCGRPTTDVDHVIPLRDGGRHTLDNLQALCRPCHSAKTARDNHFGGAHD